MVSGCYVSHIPVLTLYDLRAQRSFGLRALRSYCATIWYDQSCCVIFVAWQIDDVKVEAIVIINSTVLSQLI